MKMAEIDVQLNDKYKENELVLYHLMRPQLYKNMKLEASGLKDKFNEKVAE